MKMRVRDGLSDGRRDEQGVAAERGEGGELEMACKGSSRGEGDEREGDGSAAILRQRRRRLGDGSVARGIGGMARQRQRQHDDVRRQGQ